MLDEDIRLARQQIRAEGKQQNSFNFVAEISGIFFQMSSHDRSSRRREKIRKDLVRVQFESEPTLSEQSKKSFTSQLGKLLRLD